MNDDNIQPINDEQFDDTEPDELLESDDDLMPEADDDPIAEDDSANDETFGEDGDIEDIHEDENFEDDEFVASDEQEEIVSDEDSSDDVPIGAETVNQTSDELDIDAALAAVSQLTLLTDDEPITDDAYDTLDEDDLPDASPSTRDPHLDYTFDLPQTITMSRGQLASVIPAFILIAVGGWLTFTLTTANTAPSSGLLFSIALIGIGAVFLAGWLTSGRWSRGNFFVGTSTLLIGAIQLYQLQSPITTPNSSWSLWLGAMGVAMFGASIVTLPRLPRLGIMGVLTIVAGGIAYLLTSGTIEASVLEWISNLWFVGVAIAVFLLIAPLIRRRV